MLLIFLYISEHSSDDDFGAGIGLLSIGLLVFFAANFLTKSKIKNKDNRVGALGTIVEMEKIEHEGKVIYRHVVEYKTLKGEKIKAPLDHNKLFKRYPIGHGITVFYDPEQPSKHYTIEGQKQNDEHAYFIKFVGLVFAGAGVIVLSIVNDYGELYLVREFKKLIGQEPSSELIDRCFMLYGAHHSINGLYLWPDDCDSQKIANDPKMKAAKNKFSFYNFDRENVFYSDINGDEAIDACYTFVFKPCGNPNCSSLKESQFLILSKPGGYYVDDSFFISSPLDTLGDIYIDSVSGGNLFGRSIIKLPKENASISPGKKFQITFSSKKICVF